jgi:long-chain acyl-CoA synthetase
MLYQKLVNVDPAKVALVFQSKEITYGQLLQDIRIRAAFFQNHQADYLLNHVSEIENLLNFLTLMLTGQKGVFAGKNTSAEQCIALCEKFNLTALDFVPKQNDELEVAFQPKQKDVFLGLLTAGQKIIWKDYQSWFTAFPAQSEVFKITSEDRVLVLDALGYSANLNTVLHTLWLGATVIFTGLKDADEWSGIIKKAGVSSLFLVPSHLRLLPENNHFSGVNSVVTAGEKLDGTLAKKLLKLFPQATLTEYYGAAELGHISYIQNQEIIDRPTSVGKAFPGVNIEILNERISVESTFVSPDYRDNPTVNDIGFIDSDGYLTLLGREGRIFNRRKVNLLAEEIASSEVFQIHFCRDFESTEESILLLSRPKKLSQDKLNCFLIDGIAKKKFSGDINQHNEEVPHTDTSKINFKILSKRPVEEESSILPLSIAV